DEAARSAGVQEGLWEAQKAEERAAKAADAPVSVLDDVPLALPATLRAAKIQKRMARTGFDWRRTEDLLVKVQEEARELVEAEARKAPDEIEDEMGDLLFVAVNLARRLNVDPEAALRRANTKVERRFRAVEDALRAEGRSPDEASLEEMDALWDEAKAAEKS
ncbi:MAG: MazG nucleotide pyrophosphohydrolase domain-containing protein, partial [Pseudomonadota bacterium]